MITPRSTAENKELKQQLADTQSVLNASNSLAGALQEKLNSTHEELEAARGDDF